MIFYIYFIGISFEIADFSKPFSHSMNQNLLYSVNIFFTYMMMESGVDRDDVSYPIAASGYVLLCVNVATDSSGLVSSGY